MTTQAANSLAEFHWTPQPKAAKYVASLIESFLEQCPAAATLADRMRDETGTRFYDWVGHIALSRRDPRLGKLHEVGYTVEQDLKSTTIFTHEGGIFPTIVVWDGEDDLVGRIVRSLHDHLGEEEVWPLAP